MPPDRDMLRFGFDLLFQRRTQTFLGQIRREASVVVQQGGRRVLLLVPVDEHVVRFRFRTGPRVENIERELGLVAVDRDLRLSEFRLGGLRDRLKRVGV